MQAWGLSGTSWGRPRAHNLGPQGIPDGIPELSPPDRPDFREISNPYALSPISTAPTPTAIKFLNFLSYLYSSFAGPGLPELRQLLNVPLA